MRKKSNIRELLLACSFLSGWAALTYEILWVRLFSLIFGHTTFAVSTVLAAFMAGLALGSFWGGRWADQPFRLRFLPKSFLSGRSLLQAYAITEIGLAFLGVLSGPMIRMVESALNYLGIGQWMFWYQSLGWFVVLFALLLPATFLMGVTLPLVVVWAKKTAHRASENMSSFYGANTAGAALGTLLAGLVLPPYLGIAWSLRFAAFLNVLAAGIAWRSYQMEKSMPAEGDDSASAPEDVLENAPRPGYARVCVIVGLSGFAALLFEVGWTRALALVLGSSIYAFTIMLFTFLLGLALGSAAFQWMSKRRFVNLAGLGWVQYGIAGFSLASIVVLGYLPYLFVHIYPILSKSFYFLEGGHFICCALVMIMPTFLMGLSLPWALAVVETSGREGSRLGGLYAANTIGSILGSVLAGFLLIPSIGVERTLLLGLGVNALAFLAASFHYSRRRLIGTWAPVGALGLLAGLFAVAPRWNKTIMSSGMFVYAEDYDHKISFRELVDTLEEDRLLFYKDGISATIAVFEEPSGNRYLRTNGKTDASSRRDMETQLMVGYLPLFLHPNPAKALVIGFGSGTSAGAVVQGAAMERVDQIEIESAVLAAAPYFRKENNNVLLNPKMRFHLTDARHWLASTEERYDVIVSEPSNPWIAGVANLYSIEAFGLARRALAPGGIFCQWFHSYSMSEKDFKMVLATFLNVFPNAQLFNIRDVDFLIVGANGDWDIDYERISRALAATPAAVASLTPLGLNQPYPFLMEDFMLANDDLRAYIGGRVDLNTDDRPILEFSAPKSLYMTGEQRKINRNLASAKMQRYPDGFKNFTRLAPGKKAGSRNRSRR
ncbi:MAG: fused MFS/spermidine synthase [Elusimicrobia bacterium]|nr:fused MFS/spermidine synthase [Elusimicrobiota bacterium]